MPNHVSVAGSNQLVNSTNATIANTSIPFITNSTSNVADRIKPEQAFEEPQYSSSFSERLSESVIGDLFGQFENMMADIANSVIERRSTQEHENLLGHYGDGLKHEILTNQDKTRKDVMLSGYLINLKVLLDRNVVSKEDAVNELNEYQKLSSYVGDQESVGTFEKLASSIRKQNNYQNHQVDLSKRSLFDQNYNPCDPAIELSELDGKNGFLITPSSRNEGNREGSSVSGVGDVNGDKISDLIVGAPDSIRSSSYVVFGKENGGFNPVLDENELDGKNGFVIVGGMGDRSGFSVSGAGDVNNDGVSDIIIGDFNSSSNNKDPAHAYVVFGRMDGDFSQKLDLSALDGKNGFVIDGIEQNEGFYVSGIGDINNDKVDDVIVGSRSLFVTLGRGNHSDYVVFGKKNSTFPSMIELSNLDGKNGFTINRVDTNNGAGSFVSGAGDINHDGISDMIIGNRSPQFFDSNDLGSAYVVFGKPDGNFGSVIDLANLDGKNGFVASSDPANNQSGFSVSGIGDINGDGVSDVIIGAYEANPDNHSPGAGQSYVVFGKKDGSFNSAVDLSALDGKDGFIINGKTAGDKSGTSVSGAGDVNNDKVDDLVIGAPGANPNNCRSGSSYIVFGKSTGFFQ